MNNTNSNLEFRKIKSLLFLYEINENGTILRNVKSKKQIRIKLDKHHSKVGYYAAFVSIKHEVKRVMIHKAVAECWLGDKPDGFEIDHIDRNPHNNHYSNLRYVNHSEQTEYVTKPVTLFNTVTKETLNFPSIIKASEYISQYCDNKYKKEHIRSKMKKRRSHIYNFDVNYQNAETKRIGSTEQEIVH